jgi:uncharacterized protein
MLTESPPEPVMSAVEPNIVEPSNVESNIETPCVHVCALHPVWRLCSGCGRSLQEIEAWVALGGEGRAQIMAQLPRRLKAMAGTGIAPAA